MDALPPNALLYLPALYAEVKTYWPDMPNKYAFASQIEQETCISLKSKGCWNPKTELKTSREYGFGFGQITVTDRFNVFKEVQQLDPTLQAWKWEERYNPQLQLRALVLKDKVTYDKLKVKDIRSSLSFMLAGYNGGIGGVLSDRRVCQGTPGCNPNLWRGNVENTSLKQKSVTAGYGQSFFQINRGYVVNVLDVRLPKYISYQIEQADAPQ